MSRKAPSNLLEVNDAVGSYLDDMLHEATSVAEKPVQDVSAFDDNLLPDELLLENSPGPDQPTVIDLAIEKSDALIAEIETEFIEKVDEGTDLESEIEGASEIDVPAALPADLFPLQCLMFKVADNLLSIPLIELQSVVNWTDNLTRLPQEPDWMLGVLKHRDHNVRIADSVKILQIKSSELVTPEHILVIGDEKWAITCDHIDKVVTLAYDDIQWNVKSDNTLTLGTIRNTLASLLSLEGITHRLEAGGYQG